MHHAVKILRIRYVADAILFQRMVIASEITFVADFA